MKHFCPPSHFKNNSHSQIFVVRYLKKSVYEKMLTSTFQGHQTLLNEGLNCLPPTLKIILMARYFYVGLHIIQAKAMILNFALS